MPSAVPAASATGDSDVIELETYATANTTPTPPGKTPPGKTPPGKTPPTRRRRGLGDVPAPDEKRSVLKLVLCLGLLTLILISLGGWYSYSKLGNLLSDDHTSSSVTKEEKSEKGTKSSKATAAETETTAANPNPPVTKLEKTPLDELTERLTKFISGELSAEQVLAGDILNNIPEEEIRVSGIEDLLVNQFRSLNIADEADLKRRLAQMRDSNSNLESLTVTVSLLVMELSPIAVANPVAHSKVLIEVTALVRVPSARLFAELLTAELLRLASLVVAMSSIASVKVPQSKGRLQNPSTKSRVKYY